jgi:diguanylate cyclase (GGDEF)-like protein
VVKDFMEIQYLISDMGLRIFYIVMAVIVFLNITEKMVTQREKMLFRKTIAFYIIFILSDIFWYLNDSNVIHWGRKGMYLISTAYVVFQIGCAYNILMLCMTRMRCEFVLKRRNRLLLMIPVWAVLLTVVFTMDSTYIFQYSDGYIEIGAGYPILQALTGVYMPMLFVNAAYHAKTEKNPVIRKENRNIMLFSFVPFFCYVTEMFFTWATTKPYVILGSIVWLFLLFQSRGLNTDFLTSLNNRVRLEMYFHEISGAFAEKKYYIFMIDINDFKSINDTYGHVEGDHALVFTSDALREVARKTGCFVARYGGDEFTIISDLTDDNPEQFSRMIMHAVEKKAQEVGAPYPVSISVGYARCVRDLYSFGQTIDLADEMMYQNKKKRKSDGQSCCTNRR